MKYEKLTQQEHVLKRPDMYIGNMHPSSLTTFIYDEELKKITQKDITVTDGLTRIFIEPLSNAIDNVVRSKEFDIATKFIKVNIEGDKITITNDGYTIPVEFHETEKDTYIPQMLFGQLLTSSNYNDNEQRYTSGKNGIGVSCTNLFSKEFEIECADTKTQKKYNQVWTDNMSNVSKPKISSYKNKYGYTKISWIADFKRFGVENYSQDIINLFKRYLIDTGMITKLDVYFNDEKYQIKTLLDYAKLFNNINTDELSYFKDEKYEAVLGTSNTENFEQISFVNGINTIHGGVHVDNAVTSLIKPICEKLNKSKKDVNLKELKSLFTLFLTVNVPNPEFSSQSKTKLTSPNIKIQNITPSIITKILKWSSIEQGIQTFISVREITTMKKTEKKNKVFKAIKGYDPANLIRKKPEECTLILCEGLSAKTFAVTGITVGIDNKKGRDYWGIYALRGKLLNTRNAGMTQISKNKEIVDMIQILNLKFDVDYSQESNFKTLNYGKILIITDQDTDGFHITGLIMNFFHSMFPSLFFKPGFISSMFTPIMNITVNKKTLRFYNLEQATEYLKTAPKNATVKYLKGLGSSNDQDIKDTFGKLLVLYRITEQSSINTEMEKIFHQKYAEQRKEWLRNFKYNQSIINVEGFITQPVIYNVSFEEFLNVEMIKYSMEDCIRNLPNIYDGLKQSQRKILHAFLLKGENTKMKVSQWAGFVSEKTCYHHGEQCLFDTIIKMAQDFVGSNNIPLLQKDGQFGTRLHGGKDAASSRYIFAQLSKIVKLIFRTEDECVLQYQYDDGTQIEPVNFLPIIPMLLVNGSVAIATGWSTNIPCFNPKDLIKWIKNYVDDGVKNEIVPWYHGYKGSFVKKDEKRYSTSGIAEKKGNTWIIKELPVGMWIDNYKQTLEELLELKKIKTLKNYSTVDTIHFEIQMIDTYDNLNEQQVLDFLGLNACINLNNMVMLVENGIQIEKYDSIVNILTTFCDYRLEMYQKRKECQLLNIKSNIEKLENKLRFVQSVVDNEISIGKISKIQLVEFLQKHNYLMIENSYNYLLQIPIYDFTRDSITHLQQSIQELDTKYNNLSTILPKNIWFNELDELNKILM
jgi:DNA topoisomerase-2